MEPCARLRMARHGAFRATTAHVKNVLGNGNQMMRATNRAGKSLSPKLFVS